MPLLTLHCQVGTDIYEAGTDPGALVGGCIPNPDAWDNGQPYGGYPENPDCPEHWQSIGHYTDPNAGSSSADLAALEARVGAVEALPVRTGHRHVVADMAARDALELGTQDPPLEIGDEALVIDASADATVDAGRASYIWDGNQWLKDTEQESLDQTQPWNATLTAGTLLEPGQPTTANNVHDDLLASQINTPATIIQWNASAPGVIEQIDLTISQLQTNNAGGIATWQLVNTTTAEQVTGSFNFGVLGATFTNSPITANIGLPTPLEVNAGDTIELTLEQNNGNNWAIHSTTQPGATWLIAGISDYPAIGFTGQTTEYTGEIPDLINEHATQTGLHLPQQGQAPNGSHLTIKDNVPTWQKTPVERHDTNTHTIDDGTAPKLWHFSASGQVNVDLYTTPFTDGDQLTIVREFNETGPAIITLTGDDADLGGFIIEFGGLISEGTVFTDTLTVNPGEAVTLQRITSAQWKVTARTPSTTTTINHQIFNNPNLGSMNNPGTPANGVPQERQAFSYTPTTDEQIEVTVFGRASAGTLGFQIGTTALGSDVFFPAAADRVTTTVDTHTETLTLTAGVEVFFSVFAGGGGIISRSGLSVRAIQSGDIVLPDITPTTYAVPVDATLALVNEYRPSSTIPINNTLFTTGFDFSQVDVIEFVLRDTAGNLRQWATQALDAKELLSARTAFLHVFDDDYCLVNIDNAGDETNGAIRIVDVGRAVDLVAIRFLSYVPSGEGKRRVSFFDAGNAPINTTTFVTGIDLTSVDTIEFNIRDDINNFRQWPISSLDAAQLVEVGEAFIHTFDNDHIIVTVVDATTGELTFEDVGRNVSLVDVSGFVFGNLEAPSYRTDTTLFFEGFNVLHANAVRQEYVDGFPVTVLEDASASFANYNLNTNLPLTRPITHRVKVLRDSVTPGDDFYFRYAWPSNIAAVRVDMAAGTAVTEGNQAARVTIDNLVVTEKWIEVTATWSADARWEVFSFHPSAGGTAASVGVNRIIDIGYDIEPTPPVTSATAAFTHTRTSTAAETVNIPAGFTNPVVCVNCNEGDARVFNVTATSFDVTVFDSAGTAQSGVLQVHVIEATS